MHACMQFGVILYEFLCCQNLSEQQSVTATQEPLKWKKRENCKKVHSIWGKTCQADLRMNQNKITFSPLHRLQNWSFGICIL